MPILLFDLQAGKVIPTSHCYTIGYLKDIMDRYPDNEQFLRVYAYLFYMTYPYPDHNPYFNMPEGDKELQILEDVRADFSTDDDEIVLAKTNLDKMYGTPITRAYAGLGCMMDKLTDYMKTMPIVDGRDGNGTFILQAATKFDGLRKSFKGTLEDLQAEQAGRSRGGAKLSYDSDDL